MPPPFNDAAKYGRTNCWGYARVLESTFPDVAAGSYFWGYLPIGTLPQDLEVEGAGVPGHVTVTSAYRQHLMRIYNRYRVYPESKGLEIQRLDEGIAYDALFRVMVRILFTRRFEYLRSVVLLNTGHGTAIVAVVLSATIYVPLKRRGEQKKKH